MYDNLLIGSILFIFLILVNFLIMYKGVSHICSAHARLSLETFPARIIVIEDELENNIIDEKEAKYRKENLIEEISFNGIIDGLSQFLKVMILFNIFITFLNIVVGFCMGIFQYKMTITHCISTYVTVAIGNGIIIQLMFVSFIVLFLKIKYHHDKNRK